MSDLSKSKFPVFGVNFGAAGWHYSYNNQTVWGWKSAPYNHSTTRKCTREYYSSLEMGVFRVGFASTPLFPNSVVGVLNDPDPAYIEGLMVYVRNITGAGQEVLLDLHDYGAIATGGLLVMDQDQTVGGNYDTFHKAWQTIYSQPEVKNNPLVRIGVMNEPHIANAQWIPLHNRLVADMRAEGVNNKVHFAQNNGSWFIDTNDALVQDPINNTVIEIHQYWATNEDGSNYLDPGALSTMMARLVQYWKVSNTTKKLFFGELGIDQSDNCLNDLKDAVAIWQKYPEVFDGMSFWTGQDYMAGSTYLYSLAQSAAGIDNKQFAYYSPNSMSSDTFALDDKSKLYLPTTHGFRRNIDNRTMGVEYHHTGSVAETTTGEPTSKYLIRDISSNLIRTADATIASASSTVPITWVDDVDPFGNPTTTLRSASIQPFNSTCGMSMSEYDDTNHSWQFYIKFDDDPSKIITSTTQGVLASFHFNTLVQTYLHNDATNGSYIQFGIHYPTQKAHNPNSKAGDWFTYNVGVGTIDTLFAKGVWHQIRYSCGYGGTTIFIDGVPVVQNTYTIMDMDFAKHDSYTLNPSFLSGIGICCFNTWWGAPGYDAFTPDTTKWFDGTEPNVSWMSPLTGGDIGAYMALPNNTGDTAKIPATITPTPAATSATFTLVPDTDPGDVDTWAFSYGPSADNLTRIVLMRANITQTVTVPSLNVDSDYYYQIDAYGPTQTLCDTTGPVKFSTLAQMWPAPTLMTMSSSRGIAIYRNGIANESLGSVSAYPVWISQGSTPDTTVAPTLTLSPTQKVASITHLPDGTAIDTTKNTYYIAAGTTNPAGTQIGTAATLSPSTTNPTGAVLTSSNLMANYYSTPLLQRHMPNGLIEIRVLAGDINMDYTTQVIVGALNSVAAGGSLDPKTSIYGIVVTGDDGKALSWGSWWVDSSGAGSYSGAKEDGIISHRSAAFTWARAIINPTANAITAASGTSYPAGTTTLGASTDGVTWVDKWQSGAASTKGLAAYASIPFVIGASYNGGGGFMVQKVEVYCDDVLVMNPDFTQVPLGATTFNDTCATPNTWTATGTPILV